MNRIWIVATCLLIPLTLLFWIATKTELEPTLHAATAKQTEEPHRSPVDCVLTNDEHFLISANSTSNSISLIDVKKRQVIQEIPCEGHPSAIAMASDDRQVLVACEHSGALKWFGLADGKLTLLKSLHVGFQPRGVAIKKDQSLAYVSMCAADQVAVIDLKEWKVIHQIDVDRWPRAVSLTPDETRLAVTTSGSRTVSIIDTQSNQMLFAELFDGINAGQMQMSQDGTNVYFPNMIYRHNPINPGNIRLGWVLGSRVSRMRTDKSVRRFAITLDERGKAISDPHGIAITSDEQWMVVSGAGTHELLVYKMDALYFQDIGGPNDHIEPNLLGNSNKYYRFDIGGRPLNLRMSKDNQHVYVANYLLDEIQIVNFKERKVVASISLGGPEIRSLARQGEAIFYDGRVSLDQWYSCHSCHFEGGTNAQTMDTLNDGTVRTFKTVLPLYNLPHTPPWTWHGWQKSLPAAMRKSTLDTMQGRSLTNDEVKAMVAYFETLVPPPNPYLLPNGMMSEAAQRGKVVFEGNKAGCSNCHSGTYFTDGELHDVGTASKSDYYEGYNTPSLIGTYQRIRFLHHGRAKSLDSLLTEYHNPKDITGNGELTEQERSDLIAYLKSL